MTPDHPNPATKIRQARLPMPNTIVWATDGSEDATRALARARDILPDGDALIAVHIVQDSPPSLPDSPTPSDLLGRIQRLVLDVSDQGLRWGTEGRQPR